MRIIGKTCVAVCFGLMSLCQAVRAQIVINPSQPGATKLYQSSEESACGGWCTTWLAPDGVLNLGNSATDLLVGDMAAQFPGWTVNDGGQLAGTSNITIYEALNGVYPNRGPAPVAGANLEVTGAPLPASAHWIQVVTDNYNGYNDVGGEPKKVSKVPGQPENVIDILPPVGSKSPFYQNGTPPHFEDGPTRPEPTAANPSIDWLAQLFLVSQTSATAVTVYGGLEWGWDATYSATKSPFPPGAKVYDVSASGLTTWGKMTVTGSVAEFGGKEYYNLEVKDSAYSYDFNNATGLTELSEIPQPACVLGGCTNSPLNMSLAYTASIGTGFFSAGLVDAGEDFSATGTLTARGGASNGLFETAAVSGVPEPSTWAMALIGFAGLMGYRALRMTSAAAA